MSIDLSPELYEALQTLATVARDTAEIGKRTDPARKLTLVQLRRKLAIQIGHVSQLIDQDRVLQKHPAKRRELDNLFSAVRYALGQHQADWPAVKIDDDPSGYAMSAQLAYAKSDELWKWCKANLNFRGKGLQFYWGSAISIAPRSS
jgi:hypothetical protein